MKLKDIEVKRRLKSIRVYARGDIILTAPLVRFMGIQEGDFVKFVEREGTKELYIKKADVGIPVYKKNKKGDACSLTAYSKDYCRLLLKGDEKGIFRIGEKITENGVDYFTIIYKKNYATQL